MSFFSIFAGVLSADKKDKIKSEEFDQFDEYSKAIQDFDLDPEKETRNVETLQVHEKQARHKKVR
jgi:hypothetical protein